MLSKDTAERTAIRAAKKADEPFGVFEITGAAQRHPGTERRPLENLQRYFTRKLAGTPPANAQLITEIWPNGTIKQVTG